MTMYKWLATSSILAAISSLPHSGTAAAWPRGKDNGFVSLSYQLQLNKTEDQDYSSLFFEYGISEALTLGMDAGYNPASSDRSSIFFLRQSLATLPSPNVLSVELGVGVVDIEGDPYAVARPGLSWGRGWQADFGSGWTGLEASYSFRGDGSGLAKIDTTFGYNHTGGSLSILQVQIAKPSDTDWSVALAPSYVQNMAGDWFIELGASQKLSNGASSVKFGFWKSF